MGKIFGQFVNRPTNGRRVVGRRIGPRAVLFFIGVIVAVTGLSLWMEGHYRNAENIYRLYLAQHPLKPGEKPPKVDWLTGRLWR